MITEQEQADIVAISAWQKDVRGTLAPFNAISRLVDRNAALRARVAELEATLEGIANASPKVFDCPYQDFPHEFLPWARSRARDAIARPTVEVRRV